MSCGFITSFWELRSYEAKELRHLSFGFIISFGELRSYEAKELRHLSCGFQPFFVVFILVLAAMTAAGHTS